MSIEVGLAELAQALAKHPFAYLLTVGDAPRPHVVASSVAVRDGVVTVADAGRRTRTAIAVNPAVTLLAPPAEPGGYSLIVDGTGVLTDDAVLVTPSRAVLHRPAPMPAAAPADGSCGQDCVPIPLDQGN
jgi:hypothetical protein